MFKGARFEEYTDMDVLQVSLPVENAARWTLTCSQMIGRAGRPQFDTSGVALIMTESPLQSHYEDLVNSQTMLESCLHKNLTEHVNSEITLRSESSSPLSKHLALTSVLAQPSPTSRRHCTGSVRRSCSFGSKRTRATTRSPAALPPRPTLDWRRSWSRRSRISSAMESSTSRTT